MGDIAVRIEGLGKKYFIGGKQEAYRTFRESINDIVTAPVRRIADVVRGRASSAAGHTEIMWALKDISFDVKRGEALGIIGRNGAGKSTLLKILSRITEPSEGQIKLNGRVGALLEVGTGFHPELTGRENIYLNAAILGMSRNEIDRKFDEIVSFSGVEKFIDTPVKYYSSGMGLRLGFAVAAHLEPEILVVDEVLAVGDAEFQKKCLGKMSEVAGEGRTVLFVSHNMAAIQALCKQAIVLQSGQVIAQGTVEEGVNAYLRSVENLISEQSLEERTDREGGQILRFEGVDFLNGTDLTSIANPISGQDVAIRLRYVNYSDETLNNVILSIGFFLMNGQLLFACRSEVVEKVFSIPPGEGFALCRIPKWPLKDGSYSFNIFAERNGKQLDWIKEAGIVQVVQGDYYGTGKIPAANRPGVLVAFDWDE